MRMGFSMVIIWLGLVWCEPKAAKQKTHRLWPAVGFVKENLFRNRVQFLSPLRWRIAQTAQTKAAGRVLGCCRLEMVERNFIERVTL
jgi:hypothetical protein